MTLRVKNPAAGGAAGLENASLPGGIDYPSNTPEIDPTQTQIERNPRGAAEAEFEAEIALTALNPIDLRRRRLRDEIIKRIDMAAWAHCQATEAAERESLNKYIKAWPKAAAQ